MSSEDASRIKYYRDAPVKLAAAVEHFNARARSLQCVLTLGDIIDGNTSEELTRADFQTVLAQLGRLSTGAPEGIPAVYHTIGNHCLNIPRPDLLQGLGLSQAYYDVRLHPGWRLVVLDSMDLSILWPEGCQEHTQSEQFLKLHPLVGNEEEPQMKAWNGGVGKQQLDWLRGRLQHAAAEQERVILALHHPLAPGSAPDNLLAWNFQDLLGLISEFPCVALVLCGHHHPGGYTQLGGTHFVTLEAILEAPPEQTAHGFAHVYQDRIEIEGCGVVTSRKLALAKP